MLARTRIFLDEATADLYTDANVYIALAEAQREIAFAIATNWYNRRKQDKTISIPLSIMPLVEVLEDNITTGQKFINVTNMIIPIALLWAFDDTSEAENGQPCIWIDEEEAEHIIRNSLLAGGYYAWWDQTGIYVNPVSTSDGAYRLRYIEEIPLDIDSSNDATLNEIAHEEIIERALWILRKDRETQQAQAHLQLYGTIMQGLMQ